MRPEIGIVMALECPVHRWVTFFTLRRPNDHIDFTSVLPPVQALGVLFLLDGWE
jgi:hypothetical protein